MHTIEDISAIFDTNLYDADQLEIMRLVASNYSLKEIAEEKNISSNALQKRMEKIYAKIGMTGAEKGKFKELGDRLEKKLESRNDKKRLLITYFCEEEKTISKILGEIIVSNVEASLVVISTPIEEGKIWKDEVDSVIEEADIGIACFFSTNLEHSLANSSIGFLSSKLKNFNFVYFGGSSIPHELDHFDSINAVDTDKLATVRSLLTENSVSEEKRWIEFQMSHPELNWRKRVREEFKSFEHKKSQISSRNLVESTPHLTDILKLLDNDVYQYEHNVINELVRKFCPSSLSWLCNITVNLINEIEGIKDEVESELMSQGFSTASANTKMKIEADIKKISEILSEDENFSNFPIKVCVLRVMQDNKSLVQKGYRSSSEVIERKRNSKPRPFGMGLVHIAVATKAPIIVKNIDEERLKSFVNSEWIQANNLGSFMTFPILSEDEVRGTLTMYGEHEYDITKHKQHLLFVCALIELISNILIKLDKIKTMKYLLFLNREQYKILKSPINSYSLVERSASLIKKSVVQ